MTSLLPVPITATGTDIVLADLQDEADAYLRASRSQNTLRAYASDWKHFTGWCAAHRASALPADPATVVLYLTDLARTAKPSTIRRRMSAISVAHQAAGCPTPTNHIAVRSAWAGIRRTKGVAQAGKDALLTDQIRSMVNALPDNLLGIRDRCLLLVGFASALRRSELVALNVQDVADTHDGLVVTVTRSKTDQDGEGRQIGVPYGSNPTTCPVRALRAWLDASNLDAGPLFRPVDRHGQLGVRRLSDRAVALVVKRAAQAAGLNPALVAGHSLRSGMATSAARAGATEAQIMAQTGHKSLPVLRRYIRRGSLFTDNAASKLGL
jgi:site-specific recombinase XerD